MADFSPVTTIQLFEGTGVDDSNQPYFTNSAAKLAWYRSHPTITYTAYSYQRENRRYMRVDDNAERLRHCDMLAFQNDENKWVFARIEEIEFINPNCSEITYSVDYMQTYIEDIKFGPCWVEREMQSNDWYGSEPSFNNLQPEGIETGKFTRTKITANASDVEFKSFQLVILCAYDEDGAPTYDVRASNNYPSGVNMFTFPIPINGSIPGLNAFLAKLAHDGKDLSTAIVGMFIVPSEYGGTGTYSKSFPITPPYPRIAGYEVANSKCFSSEFFKLEISNRRGNEQELKMENFTETSNIIMVMTAGFGGGAGGSMLYPQGYEGNPKDFGVIKYDDAQAPFTSDAFASWLASNLGKLSISTGVSAGAAVAGALTGNALLAIGGAAGIGNTFASIGQQLKDPAAIGGQVAGSVMEIITENYGYSLNWVHPYLPNIQAIDEFFGRFGYRTNRFKKPNVDTRPKWNYVKTVGAVCRGWFSKKAQIYMENLMNNGVTFWHLSPGEEISDDWDIHENKE